MYGASGLEEVQFFLFMIYPFGEAFIALTMRTFPGAALGHAWVCAPPYFIVDASVALQKWGTDPIRNHIPLYILDDIGVRTKPTVTDVVSAPIRAQFALAGGREDQNLHYRLESRLRDFGRCFPAVKITSGSLSAKYIPAAITQSDVDLDKINEGGSIGRTGKSCGVTLLNHNYCNVRFS